MGVPTAGHLLCKRRLRGRLLPSGHHSLLAFGCDLCLERSGCGGRLVCLTRAASASVEQAEAHERNLASEMLKLLLQLRFGLRRVQEKRLHLRPGMTIHLSGASNDYW